jgi:hypothetical protein
MYDPHERKFVPLPEEFQKRLDDPKAELTPTEKIQRDWTRFSEGETVNVKGINFRVHEIGESRLVLKPLDKQGFAEKQVVA